MGKNENDVRFEGRIAGVGTDSGTRIVVGMWERSPFGRFTDVMIELDAGHRLLLAPTQEVADYVSSTYSFDEVRIEPVRVARIEGGIGVTAESLQLELEVGGVSSLGRLLRVVPDAFATSPNWLRLIDPLARVLVPGARTAGSAGAGRREFYGVTLARRIRSIVATLDGVDLGGMQQLWPPVTFGFGSAPAKPQLVDVVTTIR
jgi:hypothetical protein